MADETTGTSEVNESNVRSVMVDDAMKSLHPDQVEKSETITPIVNDDASDEAKEDVATEMFVEIDAPVAAQFRGNEGERRIVNEGGPRKPVLLLLP